ncbi:MAG: peptidase MA family metallohydrolase [candidate division Zixibacteria bacterium]|nr:peptidase MA family metallohydrolase [candidate division Zixibacteria bacterium]
MKMMNTKSWLIFVVLSVAIFATTWANKYQPPKPIERSHFIFYFDNPAYIGLSDSILNQTRLMLGKLLHDTLDYKAKVYIIDDIDYFKRLIHGSFPDWGAAVAYPPRQLIAIKSPDKFNVGKSLAELLAHEYTHLVIASRCGFYRPPRWFDEGMAMRTSTEWGWADNLSMSKAAVFGKFLDLPDIEEVNRFNEDKAHVAYAQSYLTVRYFYDEYGINAVNRFLDKIAAGKSIDKAMIAATGSSYSKFEDEVEIYLSEHYNIVTLFTNTMYLWLGLAIIVVIGGFLKYHKRRQYYKKWKEEEKLQSTDFDYGDPDNPEQLDDDEPWLH